MQDPLDWYLKTYIFNLIFIKPINSKKDMLSKATHFAKYQVKGIYGQSGMRFFAAPTQECIDYLKKNGVHNKNIVHNPT